MSDRHASAVDAALAYLRDPLVHAVPPLPEDVGPLLRIAAAEPGEIERAARATGEAPARLREAGKASSGEIIEGARRALVARHPSLERFSPNVPTMKDPVSDAQTLTKAIAAWTADILWAACPDGTTPETLLHDLTASRRHVFQAAGLFDALPWKVKW